MFINPSKMIKKGGGRGGAILGILMLMLLTISPVYAQVPMIMIVSGSGTPCESINGTYNYYDQFGGKSRYLGPNSNEIFWYSQYNFWVITGTGIEVHGNENVATPDLVNTWIDVDEIGCVSLPTVIASGYETTPTNTPYYSPTNQIPGISTPTPSVPGTCPDEVRDPDRELSLNWIKVCSICPTGSSVITPIPRLPTISYGYLNTPIPTITPVVTPGTATPTSVPNQIVIRSYNGTSWTNITKEVAYVKPVIYGTDFTSYGNVAPYPQKFGLIIDGGYNFKVGSNIYDHERLRIYIEGASYLSGLGMDVEVLETGKVHIELPVGTTIHFNANQRLYVELLTIAETDALDPILPGNYKWISGLWHLKLNVTVNGPSTYNPETKDQFVFGIRYDDLNENTFNYGFETIKWYPGEVPYTAGYCNDYVYADEEEADDPLVGMPDISIWQGVCMDFVPPFSWFRDSGGSYLFDVDLSFPGIGICPIWVELGDMELAGITIPMDILFLPAVMFIFGLLFKM